MTPPEQLSLPEAVPVARLLLACGHRDRAAALLRQHLSSLDPDTAGCDAVLGEAAALFSAVTGDPRWGRYAERARRHLPPPRSPLSQPARSGSPQAGPPVPRQRRAPDSRPAGRSPLRLLHHAQALHALGRCGEAVRAATRALTLWHTQHHHADADATQGGATLLIWLTALLHACRRDEDAETHLAADHHLLPAAGTPQRYDLAVYAITTLTRVSATHDQICARRHPPPGLTDLTTTAADMRTGTVGPAPNERWWQLLLTLTDPP